MIIKKWGNQTALIHTEVPKQLQGTGAASALVEKTLAHIKAQQRTVLPFCPYVFAYIKIHSEWKEIVTPLLQNTMKFNHENRTIRSL